MRKMNRNVRATPPRRANPAAGRKNEIGSLFGSDRKAALKLGAATDAGQFWSAAQALIAQAAPSSTRWLCIRPMGMATAMMLLRETAPRSGASAGQAKPRKPNEGESALLKELFSRHPAILHFRHNSGLPSIHLNPVEAGEDRPLSPSLSEAKFGAALAFWKRKRIQGVLLLHRTEGEGDFSEAEMAALLDLHPYLETALRRILSARHYEAQRDLLAGIFKPLPLSLVLCDWRLKIICESAEGLAARSGWEIGEERARTLNRSTRRVLPSELAEFCRARIKVWEKAGPASRALLEKEEHELEHPHAPGRRAEISLVRQRNFPLVEPCFLFRFKEETTGRKGSAPQSISRSHFASLAPLSPREREVARLICDGRSNAGISRRLGKSVHTVKAQVHSIFRKLQVTSRSKLTALLMRGTVALFSLLSCDPLVDALGL